MTPHCPRAVSGRRRLAVAFLWVIVVGTLTGMAIAAQSRPPASQISGSGTIITDVVPADTPNATGIRPIEPGGRMLVRGLTNLRSDRNVIFVDVIHGPSASEFEPAEARGWDTDGVWSVVLDVPADAQPGTYTVRADDGNRGARREFLIVRSRFDPTTTTDRTDPPVSTTVPSPLPSTTTFGTTTTSSDSGRDGGNAAMLVVGGVLVLAAVALLFRRAGR